MARMFQRIEVAIYLLALLQLVVLLGDASIAKTEQKLCDNKNLKLRNKVDLRQTITEGCAPEVERAFNDFVVSVSDRPDSCNMEKVTNITRFFDTHLRNKATGQADGGATTLPQAFVDYAIAYGMELASRCKLSLVEDFYGYAEWNVYRSDFKELDEWIRDDGPIARLLDPISKQAQFPLPSDFIDLLPEFEDSYKTALRLTDSDRYNRAKEVCEKHFRPLYEPVILPISHLVRHGFTYNSPFLVHKMLLNRKDRKRYTRWSRVVFLCESLKDIQFIEEPAACPPEVDEVNGSELIDEAADQRIPERKKLRPIERLRHRVYFWGPHFGSMFDLRLDSAVRNYKLSLSGTDRFKRRLLKNKGRLLLAAFKSKETMASLVKRTFEIVSRRVTGKQAEELEATKKNLLSLLDSDKKSKFVKVLLKLATAAGHVLRHFAILLESILVMVSLIVGIPTAVIAYIGGAIVDLSRDAYDAVANYCKRKIHKKSKSPDLEA